MTKDEEFELARNLQDDLEKFKRKILDVGPGAWKIFLKKYEYIREKNRSIAKMSELYGMPSSSSQDISSVIEEGMENVARHCDVASQHWISTICGIREDFKKMNISQRIYFEVYKELLLYLSLRRVTNIVGFSKKELTRQLENINEVASSITERRNRFLTSNLRLVISFAIQYRQLGIPIEDLIQEGNLALVRAIEKFDISKDFKFSTYAGWWIKQSFIRLFRNQGRTIRLPSHIHEMAAKVNKTIAEVERSGIDKPSIGYISKKSNVPVKVIEHLDEVYADPLSLETEISSGKGGSQVKCLKDFIIAETTSPIEDIEEKERAEGVREAVDTLGAEHREVLIQRFGIGLDRPKTLEEVSKLLSKSRDKVRKLEGDALALIKDKLEGLS